VIAANALAGVRVDGGGSIQNPIRYNKIVANTASDRPRPDGGHANDPMDADFAQRLAELPLRPRGDVRRREHDGGALLAQHASTDFAIDVYSNNAPDPSVTARDASGWERQLLHGRRR